MMHETQFFLDKLHIKWMPLFLCKKQTFQKNYESVTKLPISENLNKHFLWFKFIHPPNNKKHMSFILRTFEKF